jgi:hypothetical protein
MSIIGHLRGTTSTQDSDPGIPPSWERGERQVEGGGEEERARRKEGNERGELP